MTKYDGIRAVDTKLNDNREIRVQKTASKGEGSAIYRWVAAGLILCGLFGLKLIENPIAEKVTAFVRDAVTFNMVDVSASDSEAGSIKVVELIEEFLEENTRANGQE